MGLIACMNDVNMKGYVNKTKISKEVLVNDVLYTNDISYMGEQGFVYESGLKGDVINVGGLKVALAKVESVAPAIDNVDDSVCYCSG